MPGLQTFSTADCSWAWWYMPAAPAFRGRWIYGLRLAWSAEQAPWWPGLDSENLSQNQQQQQRESTLYIAIGRVTIEDIRKIRTFKNTVTFSRAVPALLCFVFKAAYSAHQRQWQGLMSTAAAVPVTTTWGNVTSRQIIGPNSFPILSHVYNKKIAMRIREKTK